MNTYVIDDQRYAVTQLTFMYWEAETIGAIVIHFGFDGLIVRCTPDQYQEILDAA